MIGHLCVTIQPTDGPILVINLGLSEISDTSESYFLMKQNKNHSLEDRKDSCRNIGHCVCSAYMDSAVMDMDYAGLDRKDKGTSKVS
ncbi:hypothetical protein M0802_005893 [Mischocyttarus mexicanus]|nr:hypothetical protein M0802_005893 [Mischocyttarus mexicanus]